ncbi:hypothetical protein ACFL43_00445 [Thermodesulfobacteriota bacterium]
MQFTPPDNEELLKKYEAEEKGICGQACLAVITRNNIQSVLDQWKLQIGEIKGWAGWRQLRQYLEARGFNVKQINLLNGYNPKKSYIARVQWIGEGKKIDKPFYGWGHWTEATAHTHFVVVENFKFFCNATGWDNFPNGLQEYLKLNKGQVTSYLEISKN